MKYLLAALILLATPLAANAVVCGVGYYGAGCVGGVRPPVYGGYGYRGGYGYHGGYGYRGGAYGYRGGAYRGTTVRGPNGGVYHRGAGVYRR
jgi:hypothetical protein